jgi:hypothetical protein
VRISAFVLNGKRSPSSVDDLFQVLTKDASPVRHTGTVKTYGRGWSTASARFATSKSARLQGFARVNGIRRVPSIFDSFAEGLATPPIILPRSC